MQTFKIMFKIGTLMVYESHSTYEMEAKDRFFWQDKFSPQGHGPFPSIAEAMQHYSQLNGIEKGPSTPSLPTKEGRVIQVDFVNKKRVAGNQ